MTPEYGFFWRWFKKEKEKKIPVRMIKIFNLPSPNSSYEGWKSKVNIYLIQEHQTTFICLLLKDLKQQLIIVCNISNVDA